MKSCILFLLLFAYAIGAHAQKSGIKGQLYWLPQKDASKQQNIPYAGIPLEIFVHKLTSKAEADFANEKITKIYTPLVTRVFCKWNGSFKVKLPPGEYSVFVRYEDGYIGNLTDSQGNISPATVKKKTFAWITIAFKYFSYH